MRFNTTVATLAIVFAVPVLGSSHAFADTKTAPANANANSTNTKSSQDTTVKVTVQDGDSLSAIADANHTTWVRIYDANDSISNPDVINAGDTFRIPKDDEQLTDRYSQFVAQNGPAQVEQAVPVSTHAYQATTVRTAAVRSNMGASVGNRYAYGNCTWYVYNRKPNIGSFWGNASQWIGSAQAAGFATGSAPAAGAIGVAGDHVVYVESVSGGMVSISEMNYGGGVGVVNYRTVPAGSFYYIYA